MSRRINSESVERNILLYHSKTVRDIYYIFVGDDEVLERFKVVHGIFVFQKYSLVQEFW